MPYLLKKQQQPQHSVNYFNGDSEYFTYLSDFTQEHTLTVQNPYSNCTTIFFNKDNENKK